MSRTSASWPCMRLHDEIALPGLSIEKPLAMNEALWGQEVGGW